MKCDELKTVCYIDAYSTMTVYSAKEVDEAIEELNSNFYKRWQNRWLAIADKFK